MPECRFFICQKDTHFLTLVRYVERNAKQANLVKKAENWQWSSVWRREYGTAKQKKLLSAWPLDPPRAYLVWLNKPQSKKEEQVIELATQKGSPFGEESWMSRIVKKHHLESTLRFPGRPKNGGWPHYLWPHYLPALYSSCTNMINLSGSKFIIAITHILVVYVM